VETQTVSELENNGDGSCNVVLLELNIMLEDISEVMTSLEHDMYSEYLRLLQLTNV
jgi:hypothetical protein